MKTSMETEKIDIILKKGTFGETVLFYKNISLYFEQFNFNGINVTTPQFFLLNCLNKLEKTTYYSLSRQLPYNPTYVLRLIKSLEEKKLIERKKIGTKKVIKITCQGKEMFNAVDKERNVFFQKMNDCDISWEELITFYSVMEKMNNIFQNKILFKI